MYHKNFSREQIEECVRLGLPSTIAAKRLEVDRSTYTKYLKKYNLPSIRVYKPWKEIQKEELQACIDLFYGENRACKLLGISAGNYRHEMHRHGLQSPHTDFSNKKWFENLSVCEQCQKQKCTIPPICGKCRKRAKCNGVKAALVKWKGGACSICGYNKCVAALDFHHKDESQKDFGFGGSGYGYNIKKLLPEIKKCILICSNCHRALHFPDKHKAMIEICENTTVTALTFLQQGV